MSRRIQFVECSECGAQSPTKTTRESVVCWPLTMCGDGTMTDPQMISRQGIYKCASCFARSKFDLVPVKQEGLL